MFPDAKRKWEVGDIDQMYYRCREESWDTAHKVATLCFLDHSGVTGKILHEPIIVDRDFLHPGTFNINDPLRGHRADL